MRPGQAFFSAIMLVWPAAAGAVMGFVWPISVPILCFGAAAEAIGRLKG